MLLNNVIKDVEVLRIIGDINVPVDKIVYDSRKIEENTVFVCIKGYKVDGHDYIKQAIDSGAVAIIAEKEIEGLELPLIIVNDSRKALSEVAANFYGKPAEKLKLIGITGTNGKTTTTYLIKSILEANGSKVGLIGTIQNMIGDKIIETERTTPESLELQELFSKMVEEKVEYVVLEVSSHSLELNRVYGCRFKVACFTNLTHDHLNFHCDMESYFKTKAKLFDISEQCACNFDNESGIRLYKKNVSRSLSYGFTGDADIFATDIKLDKLGVSFLCSTPRGSVKIGYTVQGEFSVYNALCAMAACYLLDVPLETMKTGISNASGVRGRVELVYSSDDLQIFIDFAHTPDGFENIIKAVSSFSKGRIVMVFGCDGSADKTKRPKIGKVAGELADFCVVTSSDNPCDVSISTIISDIMSGLKQTNCGYVIIESRYDAIKFAIDNAQKNDIIILAGKGHETYQEIDGVKRPFDERLVVKEIIKRQ